MTWYLWALLSAVAGSVEEVIDKVILIKKPERIDPLIATFFRNFGFFFFTVLAGVLGIFGKMHFTFNINFVILALLWPLNSLSYDYFLRNVEVSRFNSLFYTFPFIFVIVDVVFFHTTYSLVQIFGVLFVVIGAILFSFDGIKKKFVVTWKGLLWLLVKMGSYVYMAILFKNLSGSVNEISFYFSVWLFVMIGYAIALFVTGKYKFLKSNALSEGFLKKTFVSKGFDFLSSIFYLEAIALASLTAVSTLDSFSPLILLVMLLGISLFTKIDTAEDFSKKTLWLKLTATAILIVGGVLFLV